MDAALDRPLWHVLAATHLHFDGAGGQRTTPLVNLSFLLTSIG
jgi:hypothetical protein